MFNNFYGQSNKVYVGGIQEAKSFQMYPNTEMILLDDTKSILYDVCVDNQGKRTINTYDIVPHIEEEIEYATKKDIECLRRELNEYFKSQTTTNTTSE